MKKNIMLKILVPLVMVMIIAAIAFIQNQPEQTSDVAVHEDFELQVEFISLDQLKTHELPIIIDFGATECIPCKEMAPVLKTLNSEFQGEAIIKFVDVWESPNSANGYPVQVIPTQVFYYSDGTPYVPSDKVSESIEFYAYGNSDGTEHIFTVHQGGLSEDELRLILEDMGVK